MAGGRASPPTTLDTICFLVAEGKAEMFPSYSGPPVVRRRSGPRGPEREGGKHGGAHALDEIARLSGILHAFLTGDRTVTILGYRSVT